RSNVRIRTVNYVFAIAAAAMLTLPLTTAGYSQAPAAQRGAAGEGQQGQGRGGRGAAPSAPTPRRADGRPIIGDIPGQKPGRWNGGPTTLPQGQLDKIPFQPWAK